MEQPTNNLTLDCKIEGLLFYRGTPIDIKQLSKVLDCTPEAVTEALATLEERLKAGGTRLLRTDTHVQLVTTPDLDDLIESIRRDELKRDIGKAGAETLAAILYRGPISRAEIDRIRGVNSAFILRNLLVRGLITRESEGKSHQFSITPELLAHLGVSHKSELPDYQSVLDQLDAFESAQAEAETNNTSV